MRIISGTLGGRRLKAPPGDATRPTSDKVREAVFNILLARDAPPGRVLDLYAGSGALGFEALSRGAGEALFVELDRKTADVIRANADELGVGQNARVVCARATEWVRKQGPASGQFNWIFLDPPYATGPRDGQLHGTLDVLSDGELLAPGGLIIAEHQWRIPPNARYGVLSISDQRRYGQTTISFYTADT